MVVINEETGLPFEMGEMHDHASSILFKIADDYYMWIMKNFQDEYYNIPAYREQVNKIVGKLSE